VIRRALFSALALVALGLPAAAQDAPKTTTAKSDVAAIGEAAKKFHADTGRVPTSMAELAKQPADLAGKWKGPYEAPQADPWGKPYTLGPSGDAVKVVTLGSDGKAGGEGEAMDVTSTISLKAPAVAQKLSLSASLESAKVEVGKLATLNVTLTNQGTTAVNLPKLAEDRQLVSFDVQLDGGRTFVFEKITPSPFQTKLDWPSGKLEPGKSWTLPVRLPALQAGKLTITTHYGRGAAPRLQPKPSHVKAAPVTLEMTPTASGADRISIRLTTSMGPIHLRLFAEDALGTSLHYARLIAAGAKAQGIGKVRQPFYRGLTFHRVIAGFMIQGGCPLGTGTADAGYSIPAEFAKPGADGLIPERLRHVPGRLSMARTSHNDSAGTQFFICTATPTHLDGKYTCFGEVTRGLDVAMTIAEVDADQSNKPKSDVTIDNIRIVPVKSK
jgi:peptidyl-prolyl cis-trans isomerase B (cyclophilin B)